MRRVTTRLSSFGVVRQCAMSTLETTAGGAPLPAFERGSLLDEFAQHGLLHQLTALDPSTCVHARARARARRR